MNILRLVKFLFILFKFDIVAGQSIQINEIVSSNASILFDEDDETPDWIELYNSQEEIINISGFGITDDPQQLYKWTFPEFTIEPNAYLVIFASDKDRTNIVNQWDAIIDWGDNWFYWPGTNQPVSNWEHMNTDLGGWHTGSSGFGYGDNDDNTYINGIMSVFIKKIFQVPEPENVSKLLFHLDYDDGYVAYLNGYEFARRNMGAQNTVVDFNQPATGLHEAEIYSGGFPEPVWINLSEFPLNEGDNIIAIEVHNYNSTSSDLSCIPFLTLGYYSERENAQPPNENMNLPIISFHTNFKIKSSGETIVLTDNQEIVLDSIYTGTIPTDMSRGRFLENDVWSLFGEPTPGTSNNTPSYNGALSKPVYSIPSGFYSNDETINISLSTDQPEAEIRFTTDNTDPLSSSQLYQYPIPINSNTVIRAKSFLADWLPSKVESKTYIFDNQPQLPTVFLSTDPENLFDQSSGIYIKGSNAEENFPYFGANFWEDWERPIHFEILEIDGTSYGANAGMKIFGGWSRGFPQKSLAIYARNYYGPSKFEYNLFPNTDIGTYEAFTLRNSGNDWQFTMLRDGFITSLANDLDIDHQRYRPAVHYINGEYWGIINIREKVNEHFITSNHNIAVSNIDLLEQTGVAVHGTNTDYMNLLEYLNNQNMSELEVYNALNQWIDIDSYMSYQAFQIFIDNRDWPGNNIKFWRNKQAGGKWRWILYDTDFGFGIWENNAYLYNTLAFALDSNGPGWPNPPWSTFLFRKMMENNDFKYSFINIYCDLLNTVFRPDYLNSHLDSMVNLINEAIPDHRNRWYNNGNWPNSTINWQGNINTIGIFSNNRYAYARIHLQNEFELSSAAQVNINIEPPGSGTIKLNSITIDEENWSGYYFPGIPLQVQAISNEGYIFSRWMEFPDSSSNITIDITDPFSLTAEFEVSGPSTATVIINEVNYNSSDEFDPKDWIELYNPEQTLANISGWILKDEDDTHIFSIPNGTEIEPLGFIVLVQNFNDFSVSFPEVNNITGSFDFGFGGGGDQVRIYNEVGDLIDSLEYDDSGDWPVGPDGNGPTLELINPEMDNTLPISWDASTNYGTPGTENSVFEILSHIGGNIIPNKSELGEVFPNPFNPAVSIPFQLATKGLGTIKIYNILGQEIVKLNLENLQPGNHIYTWKPSNKQYAGSGIFFIHMETLFGSSTKKIIYLK
ncbi:MAG: hypothetical protein CMG74_11870 [Candidatus Marinimicrobia bacterium]|nr:hypothetical protein [Candidatus Neomarinimicrobiota bacterium]